MSDWKEHIEESGLALLLREEGGFRLLTKRDAEFMAFDEIKAGKTEMAGWVGYDLKSVFGFAHADKKSLFCFPDSGFFVPEESTLIQMKEDVSHIPDGNKIEFRALTSRQQYTETVKQIKNDIRLGEVYELNFCIGFEARGAEIDPYFVFEQLFRLNRAPFSALLKYEDLFLVCGSPERFIRKNQNRLIEQPIKGTAKRGATETEDEQIKSELYNSTKERAENVMIVDLVRNDLSKIAEKGSVHVDELFGIYTFPNVHQMISTVSCSVNEKNSFNDIIAATFPMGSMTGAPKFRAVELINKYENFNRGLYSGAVGRMDKNGDFDFNVVIRSLFYDRKNRYLSIAVGSAITALSDPQQEYEECLLKAASLLKAVNGYVVEDSTDY